MRCRRGSPGIDVKLIVLGVLLGDIAALSTSSAWSIAPCASRRHYHTFGLAKNAWHGEANSIIPSTSVPSRFSKRLTYRMKSRMKQTTRTTSSLSMVAISPTLAKAIAWAVGSGSVAALASSRRIRHSLLWPGSAPDESDDSPLPPGRLGCPFRGCGDEPTRGSHEYGPVDFYHRRSERLGHPAVWKSYAWGRPFVVVSGLRNVRDVLRGEFQYVRTADRRSVGRDSIRSVRDKIKHVAIRRLMGAAMGQEAVASAVPMLCDVAEEQIDRVVRSGCAGKTINMEDVFVDFTMGVAWKQIIGLDLDNDEAGIFCKMVKVWMRGVVKSEHNQDFLEARSAIISKIEDRIKWLDDNGPDGSTLSGMVFAVDKKSSKRRLAHSQLVDNVLFLLIAGSDTTSGTLTAMMLLLGLHPDAWEKIVEEQRNVCAMYGDALSTDLLKNSCPFLSSVVRETQRLFPSVGANLRATERTIVVEGKQIPAGWVVAYSPYLTHFLDPVTRKEDGSHMDALRGFKPERWLDENTRPEVEYIPFGFGPRKCLGEHLAIAEMKIFVALIARRVGSFDLEYPSPAAGAIRWRAKCLIPIPEFGVVIRPSIKSHSL